MSTTIKENNNTDSVCILVQHFILFAIEHSIVFSRTKYRRHVHEAILIHEIISGPPSSVFLLLWHSYWAASSGVILQ